MLPERFLIAGVEQAWRGPPRLTRCKSHKKRRLACGSSAHKRRHENWVDAGQNTRLKTWTISRELSFLLISRMSRFIPQDRLGALLACVLSKTPFVGRVLLSAIFILFGLSKLSAPTATMGYIASAGLPFPALGPSVG